MYGMKENKEQNARIDILIVQTHQHLVKVLVLWSMKLDNKCKNSYRLYDCKLIKANVDRNILWYFINCGSFFSAMGMSPGI
jgi:hypothetical protein